MYRTSDEYIEIVKTIIDVYIDYDIKSFPLDVDEICQKLGVTLIPYSHFEIETLLLLEEKSQHGFFVKATNSTPPMIYYNDTFPSPEAIRFTIFHEIKHYIYNEDSNDTDKDDLANFFARYFLCPIPYLLIKGITSKEEIYSFCDVSLEAAKNAKDNIKNRIQTYGCKIFDYEIPLLEHLDKTAYDSFMKSSKKEIDNSDDFLVQLQKIVSSNSNDNFTKKIKNGGDDLNEIF